MNALISLIATLILIVVALVGVGGAGMEFLFGVIIPYLAVVTFIVGFAYRIINWARSPVPFRIPTTCGQQTTLPWIKSSNLENPHKTWGVIGRMALEILCFRSLLRNTKTELKDGPRLTHGPNLFLWIGSLAFHWSFLIIFARHFRFFIEPVPSWVLTLQGLDGFFQVGLPIIYATDVLVVAALTYLFFRRVVVPQIRYISLPADFFPLFLLLGLALSGVYMRYFDKTDIVAVKELTMGLLTVRPVVPEGISVFFFIHLFMLSVLLIYFPFSKLMHMGGVFLSPTRNLANNNRMKRHVNPWDYPVKVHTYEEYEDEFRDVMKAADMPVERE
jgi:nitrate reductase gamma subunit